MKEQDLTLVGLTEDKQKLVLVSDAGEEFTLPADTRLRAALRGEHARLGQLEITRWKAPCVPATSRPASGPASPPRTSPPPPRPASRRSWATPRRCSPSAPTSPTGRSAPRCAARPARARRPGSLGDAVAERLRAPQRRPRQRRVGRLAPGGRPLDAGRRLPRGRAPGTPIHLRRPRPLRRGRERRGPLAGRRAAARAERRSSATTAPARPRRLSAVGDDDELPLGEDAIELVSERRPPSRTRRRSGDPAEPTEDLPRDRPPSRQPGDADWIRPPQASERRPRGAGAARRRPRRAPSRGGGRTPAAAGGDRPSPRSRRPAASGEEEPGRASVPSWDEIMFGGGKRE